MKTWVKYVALLFILLLGAWLRNYHLDVWPREGATFDEFAWVFQGISLWEKGVPTSWSPHGEYTQRVEYFNPQGAHFTLVTPYLEHPPLFGLIAGGFALMRGVRSFDQVTIQAIRPLALFFGVFSIFAVFLLANEIFGPSIGLISTLLYAVVPTVVAGSRIVQNENFFIPFFLLSLYFAYRYIEHGSQKNLVPAIFIAGILPLAKIPWIAAPAAVFAMLLYAKKVREAWMTFGVTAISLLLYVAYGVFFDKSLFFLLWNLQLARYDMSFASFFTIFQNPMVTDRIFVDGWLYVGWATFALLLSKNLKKTYPVVFGFLAYFLVFLAGIPSEPGHGWYRYPFYPFLIIGLAAAAEEYFIKNRVVTFTGLSVIGLSLLENTWTSVFGFSYSVLRGYLVVCAATMIPLVWSNKRIERIVTMLTYLLGATVLVLSIWAALLYNEQ